MLSVKNHSAKSPPAEKKKSAQPTPQAGNNQLAFQLFTTTAVGAGDSEKSANAAAAGITGNHGSPPPSPPADSAPGGTSVFGTIIEDGLPLAPGQIHRSAFLQRISTAIEGVADNLLAPLGQTARDCPYLVHWLAFYRTATASHIERAIQRYANPLRHDLEGIESAVLERVRLAVSEWIRSQGSVVMAPGGVEWLGSDDRVTPSTDSGFSPQQMPANGATSGPPPDRSPASVRRDLGPGQAMEGGLRARMEQGFAADFAGVRMRLGAEASRLASAYSARAFTLGSDISFAEGQYQPGTLAGDFLKI